MNVQLQQIVKRYGVKACYKSLTRIHCFDPEIAWLGIWYARYDRRPSRYCWGIDTRCVEAAPISAMDAARFLNEYNRKQIGLRS